MNIIMPVSRSKFLKRKKVGFTKWSELNKKSIAIMVSIKYVAESIKDKK